MGKTLIRAMAAWIALQSVSTLTARQSESPSSDSGKSLGDVAKQVRPKDAKVTTKHVYTDDDVAHGTGAGPATTSQSANQSSLSDAQDVINRVAILNSRQLGDLLVGEIRFPGRDAWEDKLYSQKQKMVAAAQLALDYQTNKLGKAKTDAEKAAARDGLNRLLLDLSVQRGQYDRISAEGISQASAWEKRGR